jgi:transcriptional regulator
MSKSAHPPGRFPAEAMYVPPHFDESRAEVLHALMNAQPLAAVVTLGAGGLEANHVPLHLFPHEGERGVLRGHVARQNAMWRTGAAEVETLAIFQGPASYVSPSWYPTKREHGKVVPTWNYVVVHAHGRLRVHDDSQWVHRQVSALTDRQEARLTHPWAVSDAPPDYVEKMLQAIVGIEIVIERLVGKWKVSQNQPATNRAGAAEGMAATGDPAAQEMARIINDR